MAIASRQRWLALARPFFRFLLAIGAVVGLVLLVELRATWLQEGDIVAPRLRLCADEIARFAGCYGRATQAIELDDLACARAGLCCTTGWGAPFTIEEVHGRRLIVARYFGPRSAVRASIAVPSSPVAPGDAASECP